MPKTVKVVASKEGVVVEQTAKGDHVWFRVTSDEVVSSGKFVNIKERRAIVIMKNDVFDRLYPSGDLPAESTLEGRIVVRETLTQLDKNDANRGLKVAGDTGIVCKDASGAPIYRDSYFTFDAAAQDILIPHANTDEIRAAQAANKLKANSSAIKGAGARKAGAVK